MSLLAHLRVLHVQIKLNSNDYSLHKNMSENQFMSVCIVSYIKLNGLSIIFVVFYKSNVVMNLGRKNELKELLNVLLK